MGRSSNVSACPFCDLCARHVPFVDDEGLCFTCQTLTPEAFRRRKRVEMEKAERRKDIVQKLLFGLLCVLVILGLLLGRLFLFVFLVKIIFPEAWH